MAGSMPRGIVALGFVSLFMDVSSEMIHALLPVFITGTLGASASLLGLIEGVSEATGQVVKVFSGAWSDRIGRRKPLAVLGYGLSALTKPLFAVALSPLTVFGARFADRVGKGIRGAPRDALVADLAPPGRRGAAFGLRQTMDTIGAFAGPLLAIAILWLSSGNIRLVFALAIIPAVLAVFILIRYVAEPAAPAVPQASVRKVALDRQSLGRLGPAFRQVAVMGALMTFARFSEAFLVLRAAEAGLPLLLTPLVLVTLNVVYAFSAWPTGHLSDRIGSRGLLLAGLGVLLTAQVVLAYGGSVAVVVAGIALWGLHMGLTQGLLAAAIAETAPEGLRGTAFGVFSLTTGLTLLAGNAAAGVLWSAWGGSATFAAGAAVTAIVIVLALRRLPAAARQA